MNKSNWTSRKLWTTVASAIVIVGSAVTGEQSWSWAGWQLVALIATYNGIQGVQNIVAIKNRIE